VIASRLIGCGLRDEGQSYAHDVVTALQFFRLRPCGHPSPRALNRSGLMLRDSDLPLATVSSKGDYGHRTMLVSVESHSYELSEAMKRESYRGRRSRESEYRVGVFHHDDGPQKAQDDQENS